MTDNTHYMYHDRSHAIDTQHNKRRSTGASCIVDPYQSREDVTVLSCSLGALTRLSAHPSKKLERAAVECTAQPAVLRHRAA